MARLLPADGCKSWFRRCLRASVPIRALDSWTRMLQQCKGLLHRHDLPLLPRIPLPLGAADTPLRVLRRPAREVCANWRATGDDAGSRELHHGHLSERLMEDAEILRIHDSGKRFVVAVTGGGARAIGELLEVPGGSRSVLECVVPYCEAALTQYLGGRPDQCCSEETARAMAMAAFERGGRLLANMRQDAAEREQVVGVGCTASLASDRPKRGPHRVHVAWQSACATVAYSLDLAKETRTRHEEEAVSARLVLAAMAEAASQ